jgi:hypothetical protein
MTVPVRVNLESAYYSLGFMALSHQEDAGVWVLVVKVRPFRQYIDGIVLGNVIAMPGILC